MSKKVKYIKISRRDQNGNDLTNTLESLTQITIPLTIAGSKTYKILTRADFPTYYLFQIDLDNSPDSSAAPGTTSTTLNYNFSGSIDESATGSGASVGQFSIENGIGPQIATDFYNSEQKRVEINTLPREDIHISIGTPSSPFSLFKAEVIAGSNFADTASVELFQLSSPYTPNNAVQLTSNPFLTRGVTTSISRSVSIPKTNVTPGDIFFLGVKETGSFSLAMEGAKVFLTNNDGGKYTGQFYVTSSAATGPTLENIVEPYLVRRFTNSDCDVLINNANQYEENPFLQDIDFSSGAIVPVNYNQIVSGSAQKATVPESMFTMGGMINPNNSAINSTSRYNIDNSSYSSQVSAGCFVSYWKSLFTGASTSGKYFSIASLKYLISPDEELIEINSEPEVVDLLKQLYSVNANPLSNAPPYWGDPNVFINSTVSFSNTGSASVLDLLTSSSEVSSYTGTGYVLPFLGTVSVLLFTSSSFSPNPTGTDNGGGLLFPTDISLTRHKTLPARARQILTENNIIPPQK
jgi:hypothetical protein